jgi:hypothetical protein
LAILSMAAPAASRPIIRSPVLVAERLALLPPGRIPDSAPGADFIDVVAFSATAFTSGRIMVLHRLQVLDGHTTAARRPVSRARVMGRSWAGRGQAAGGRHV